MNPVILILAFIGLCVSFNNAESDTPKDDPPPNSIHPKLRRTPTIPTSDDIALAESFWQSWLGPPNPPSSEAETPSNSSSDLLTLGQQSNLTKSSNSNSTELDSLENIFLENSNITWTSQLEVMNSSSTEKEKDETNSTSIPTIESIDENFEVALAASSLFNSPDEQEIFIGQLYTALSNEIINLTAQSLLEGSELSRPLAAESAIKALASKLSPTDRALFENSIILSLAKPNPLPKKVDKNPKNMTVTTTTTELTTPADQESENVDINMEANLKLLNPNVMTVLDDVDQSSFALSPDGQSVEGSTDIDFQKETPEFDRIITILKNLFQTPKQQSQTEVSEEPQATESNPPAQTEMDVHMNVSEAADVEDTERPVTPEDTLPIGENVTVTNDYSQESLTTTREVEIDNSTKAVEEEITVEPLSPKILKLLIKAMRIAAASTTSTTTTPEPTPVTESTGAKAERLKALFMSLLESRNVTRVRSISNLYVM